MTRASAIVADAVSAVIAARIAAALRHYGLPAADTAEIAAQEGLAAVRDLRRDGWHITALPVPASHQEGHR